MTSTALDAQAARDASRRKEKRRLRMEGKRTQRLVIHVDEELEMDLMRQAAAEDRSVSDLARHILLKHMYGIVRVEDIRDNSTTSA